MKEYKVVNLNKAIHMSRDKDLAQMEENINALVAEEWELQQVISPNDLSGVMIGIFFRDRSCAPVQPQTSVFFLYEELHKVRPRAPLIESRHTWADVHAASGRLQHRNQLGKARRKGNGNRHPEDEARHTDQFPHGNRAHLADMICAVRKSNIRIEHQKDLLFLSIQEQKLISTEAAHACFAALSFCWQR